MQIRLAEERDLDAVWPIFQEIVSVGDTYGFPRNASRMDARRLWFELPRRTYLAEADGEVLGTYYLKSNHAGPGSHVCNCGYMVASAARGRGVATAMCEHSQQVARELGYKAMQFNFVASSNQGAVKLWTRLGFETVGRLPRAFDHPEAGYIDALVMYKWLAE